MKMFRSIAAVMLFAAIFSISAFAQTTGKMAVLYSALFEQEKGGITKLISGYDLVQAEFKVRLDELQGFSTKIGALDKEIQVLASNPKADPQSVNAKQAEREALVREGKFKSDSTQAAFQTRLGVVLGPVYDEIGVALQEYAKSKGYAVIFDLSKIKDPNSVYVFDDSADLTDDFIKFFNARTPGAKPTTPATKPATPATKPN